MHTVLGKELRLAPDTPVRKPRQSVPVFYLGYLAFELLGSLPLPPSSAAASSFVWFWGSRLKFSCLHSKHFAH